jgi:hypothetical protein
MKEFVMIFRNDSVGEIELTPEGTLAVNNEWMSWMGGIAAAGKLANRGARLGAESRVVNPGNVVTSGPYAEIKEIIGGLTIIKADSLEEANEIAKGCPALNFGGNVEVREVIQMNG